MEFCVPCLRPGNTVAPRNHAPAGWLEVAIDPGDIDGPLPPQGKVEWCPLTGRGKLSKAGAYLSVVSHAHCQHSHPRPTTIHYHPGDAKAHHTMTGKDKDDAMRQQRLWQLLSFIDPVHMAGVGAAPR